jgi:DNA-binding NarL/FixJ family response regulator
MLYDGHVQSSITNTEDRPAYLELPPIVLIDNRVLVRDCLAECLRASHGVRNVLVFDTVEQWQQAAAGNPNASVIVVAVGGRTYTKTIIERDLHNLCKSHAQMPIVVISDVEDFDCVTRAVQCGAKGYVPTSFDLKVTIGVIELVKAGGTFIPVSALAAAKQSVSGAEDSGEMASSASFSCFTPRQMAVVNALRQGKPNKLIAYQLNMCESTVKVHVRNIMKKLKAKNRTEVAYLFNGACLYNS